MARKRKRRRAPRPHWIRRAIRRPSALHRMMGVPATQRLSRVYVDRIASARLGTTVRRPPGAAGKAALRVTRLLKQRAVLARTLERY